MGNALVNLHCYKDAVGAFKKSIKEAKGRKGQALPADSGSAMPTPKVSRLQKLRDVGATVPGCSKDNDYETSVVIVLRLVIKNPEP